jgi:cell division protein FtsA
MQVRIANPIEIQGLKEYVNDPSYATVVGLLHYGMQAHNEKGSDKKQEGVSGWLDRIKTWFKGEF